MCCFRISAATPAERAFFRCVEFQEDHHDLLTAPDSAGGKAFFYFVYPMLFTFAYTIPDVRKPGMSNWYPITMLM